MKDNSEESHCRGNDRNSTTTQTLKELFSGTVAGVAQVLAGQPFDTVKVRLQTDPKEAPRYKGIVDCIKKTYGNEGVKGSFKGTLTPIIGIGVCVSVQFASLGFAKRLFQFDNISHNRPSTLTPTQLFLSGTFVGVANSFLCCPIEHVRTRLQTQTTKIYAGPLDFVKKVWKEWGFRGLWKGQGITLAREAGGFGNYFLCYEWLMQKECKIRDCKRGDVPVSKQVLFGGAAGYSFWAFIYPLDVIKSKLQTDGFDMSKRKYKSAWDCARQILRVDGWRGLYRGYGTCMIRAAPVNAVTFVTYEAVMKTIGRN